MALAGYSLRGRPRKAVLRRSSEQARGLRFWAPCGTPGVVNDPVQSLTVPVATATTTMRALPSGLVGVDCTANNNGYRVATTAQLNNVLPVSLMCVFYQVAAPTADSEYFRINHNSTDASPYFQVGLSIGNPATSTYLGWNVTGAAKFAPTVASTPATGAMHVLIGVVASGSQVLYLDGVSVASSSSGVASIASGTGPTISVGTSSIDNARNCGAIIFDCRVYDRALSAAEALSYTNFWQDLYLRDPTPDFRWIQGATGASGAPSGPFFLMF